MPAITGSSLGYAGEVNELTGKDFWNRIGASKYGVVGADDLKVSTTTGDRMLLVGSGIAWGHNIQDTLQTSLSVQLNSVASGSRWDLIVVRRDVTAGSSVEVVQGSSARTLPSLTSTAASHPDQPIALCRVSAGSTTVQEIIDLRCWAANGGVLAVDKLARDYLAVPGARVRIGRGEHSFEPVGNDGFEWVLRATQVGEYGVSTTTSEPNQARFVSLDAGLFTSSPNVQVSWESQSGQPPRLRVYNRSSAGFGVNVMSDVGNVSGTVHWSASQQ